MASPVLVLASRSPRRAELLAALGLAFEVCAADVDETAHPGEEPAAYVQRLAAAKAAAAARPGALCLGADTAVIVAGRILGKPADRDEAAAMLTSLAGRSHTVMTGVAVCAGAQTRSLCVATEVWFRGIEPWEAAAYAGTGEGLDKAGGYGIQGIGGIFVESIRGSYSAVVGLPLAETELLLRECGLDTWHERMNG